VVGRPEAGKSQTGLPWVFQYWRILATFAAMDVNQPASAVDAADLKVSAFLQTQAAGVDGGETGSIAKQSNLRGSAGLLPG
jgi:hypothetical protein